jgi:catechol 2,3-dioxygenase-like lactoylglutathione lyase family enzyme
MLRVGSILIRVDDLPRQTAFWTAALDYVPREDPSAPDADFVLMRPRDGDGPVRCDKRPADADYLILADPEGNRFCVIDAG